MNRSVRQALAALILAAAAVAVAADDMDRYAAAVASEDRYQPDRERDAARKPAATLAMLGVEPGMHVLDLYSGGGYYTELLSILVGPEGSVTAHNNNPYLSFAGDEIEARYTNGRLGNVERLIRDNDDLRFPDARYDAITMMLTYHDIYYEAPDNGWSAVDGDALLAELHDALKPGGAILIVDHRAPAGSPPETGGTTHRIDPAIVIREMEAAGFSLTGDADFLANESDDYSINVFDPAVRGKTDRFVLRFEKD